MRFLFAANLREFLELGYRLPDALPPGCKWLGESFFLLAESDDERDFIEMAAHNLVNMDLITYGDDKPGDCANAPYLEMDVFVLIDGREAFDETIEQARAFDADSGHDGWTERKIRGGAIFGCGILSRIMGASKKYAQLPYVSRWPA